MAGTDVQLERGLPASIDAERSIFGSIILDNNLYHQAAERLVAEDFAVACHQKLYLRMSELVDAGRAIDIITLRDILSQYKEVDAIGGLAYLSSLTENMPRRLSIDEYVRIVKEKSSLRDLIRISSSGITRAADQGEDALTIIGEIETELSAVMERGQVAGFLSAEEVLLKSCGGIEGFFEHSGVQGSISTGWSDFDQATGSLKKGELVIMAARPAMGKTAWAINLALRVARKSFVVGIISLEMSSDALLRRMTGSSLRPDSSVSMRRMIEKSLSQAEKQEVSAALGEVLELPIYTLDSPGITIPQLRAQARRLKNQYALDVLIIDYLQLMSPAKKRSNRQEEVSDISRSLKLMARELDIPVVCLSQLSRECEKRQDKRPMLSDLRESGSIEQDADVVAFLYRDEMYNDDPSSKGTAELIIAKQREGPTLTINMLYFPDKTRFEERQSFDFSPSYADRSTQRHA